MNNPDDSRFDYRSANGVKELVNEFYKLNIFLRKQIMIDCQLIKAVQTNAGIRRINPRPVLSDALSTNDTATQRIQKSLVASVADCGVGQTRRRIWCGIQYSRNWITAVSCSIINFLLVE